MLAQRYTTSIDIVLPCTFSAVHGISIQFPLKLIKSWKQQSWTILQIQMPKMQKLVGLTNMYMYKTANHDIVKRKILICTISICISL